MITSAVELLEQMGVDLGSTQMSTLTSHGVTSQGWTQLYELPTM